MWIMALLASTPRCSLGPRVGAGWVWYGESHLTLATGVSVQKAALSTVAVRPPYGAVLAWILPACVKVGSNYHTPELTP